MADALNESFAEILPLRHNRFSARWALSQRTLEKGQQVSSSGGKKARLVLRIFFIGVDSASDTYSEDWCDYSIEISSGQNEFELPKSSARINATLGYFGASGRFSPLVTAEAISLPAPTEHARQDLTSSKASSRAGHSNSQGEQAVGDFEAAPRSANLSGLPDELKSGPAALAALGSDKERSILKTVFQRLAADPYPSELKAKAVAAALESTERFKPRSGSAAPDDLPVDHWQRLWSGRAPIEIVAEIVLHGKMARNFRLMLGQSVIETDSEGVFTFNQKLETFDQVWPLLRIALEAPTVQANPALEFFKDAEGETRLLEIHGKLQLCGQIRDRDYIPLLPDQIRIQDDGQFFLTRLLPEAAVILPGLSLIAG